MATQTTNLGLTKPTTDERWNLSTWNGNMDIIDASVGAVQDGIAIVCNGNTHPAIAAGQFAYVRNHSTLAQGLYRNNTSSAIAANAALSSANLTADGSGGLNALKGDIDTLNSNIIVQNQAITISSILYTQGGMNYYEASITIPEGYSFVSGYFGKGYVLGFDSDTNKIFIASATSIAGWRRTFIGMFIKS